MLPGTHVISIVMLVSDETCAKLSATRNKAPYHIHVAGAISRIPRSPDIGIMRMSSGALIIDIVIVVHMLLGIHVINTVMLASGRKCAEQSATQMEQSATQMEQSAIPHTNMVWATS